MCVAGDIILISGYKRENKIMSKHSFIVLSDENGQIQGCEYDLICNVMSSFKNEQQKRAKLKYTGNFPITYNDTDIPNGNGKDGYIKAEQLYYFDKSTINYQVIGNMKPDTFEKLKEFIQSLDDFEIITDNLNP